MPPLFVLEFLHRIYEIFTEYFGEVSTRALTDNFSSAYQLLEEMLDNGHPMITEPNALQTLIAPPSIANRMANFVLGVSRAAGVGGGGGGGGGGCHRGWGLSSRRGWRRMAAELRRG